MNPSSIPEKTLCSYGYWTSPLSAEKLAEGEVAIINLSTDGDSTYWCEMRPANKGRYTVVKRDAAGLTQDITPPDFNVRTYVHEYGGGAFKAAKGIIYASNGSDHALYALKPGAPPIRLTQGQNKVEIDGAVKWQGTRFADLHPIAAGLIAIGEEHQPGKPVENFLALIDANSGSFKKLAAGFDFYSSPAVSPDQKKIAWICWNHPNMPWTNTELWLADFEQGSLKNARRIAGEIPESIFQPQWSPDGTLYFVTDRLGGWWNIYRYQDGKVENICPMEAEMGEPLWIFERSSYAFLGSKIVFAYNSDGFWKLGILDPLTKQWQHIPRESVLIQQIRSAPGCVRFLESYSDKPQAIVQMDEAPGYPIKVLEAKPPLIEKGYISIPHHIAFPSNGRTAYGLYYPPVNQGFQPPQGEKPPLIVMIHGGPTGQAKTSFALKTQFWTTRGFAVLDVNYGGSTGYGRTYRTLLDCNWGIVDVEDCTNGALYLSQKGLVDSEKLVIRGGSAGGYTTLAALAFKNIFRAGASYYGVADIAALARDTHKFEQKYMDLLVGKYPEEKNIWEERSPIHSVDKIKAPLIIFQGELDPIVPKNQAIMIYEALRKRGVPVELHIYPGEDHGFRQMPHVIDSINRELEFYLKVFKAR